MTDANKTTTAASENEEGKVEEKVEEKDEAKLAQKSEKAEAPKKAGLGAPAQAPVKAGGTTVIGTGFMLPGQKHVSSAASATQAPSRSPVATVQAARTIHFPPQAEPKKEGA